jgi:predicted alpha/beta superfamily hydrolase
LLIGALAPGGAAPAAADTLPVRFEVEVPASTPGGAVIWISGNVAAFGAWSGRGVELTPAGPHRFTATVPLELGAALEFKVTRGGWETVEKGPGGEEIANRTWTVAGADTVRIAVAAWRDQAEGPRLPPRHTITGNIREYLNFGSAFVGPRSVRVWLPPGYEADTALHCPVLYFHDGNNVFDAAASFLGIEWAVDEAADRLVRSGRVPPFIVVAVDHTSDRTSEYTYIADRRHGGGGASRYARFLIEELKPFIDRTCRTQSGPGATGVVGSSLGGLVSMWLGIEHPRTFGLIGVVSPAAWWADGDLARRVAESAGPGLRIWLDVGTAEGTSSADARRWVEDARALRGALLARGYRAGVDLHYEEVEGAVHNETAWAARVERLMAFLLERVPPPR